MTLDILICTYNEGIFRVPNMLLKRFPSISYSISHQITEEKYMDFDIPELNREDVKYKALFSKGLSKNRNNVINMSSSDISLIADDDVRYRENEILQIIKRFEENPEMDVFQGKIRTFEGEDYKKYNSQKKKIGWRDIGGISSIEIAFKTKSVQMTDIKFDESFGLGGNLFSKGEEAVFLGDCLKNKLEIFYYPDYIVSHPKESSTTNTIYDCKEASYWGALNYRIFKKLSYINSVLFALKHYNRYKKNITILEFLKSYFKGIKQYKKFSK